MAGSSVKIGADVTEFKRGMTEAQASVKALDATIKTNEKSMQLYGKSESYVSTQAGLLNQKLEEQRKIAQNAEKSLKAMEENGVSKTSKAYQDMQRRMMEARGAMIDTEVALNQLATGEAEAAKGADELANSIGGISKKMSLDQVIGGINNITGSLENAAKKAINLAGILWDEVLGAAGRADDTLTLAEVLGIDQDQVQKMQKVAPEFEATAEQIGGAWKKLRMNMTSDAEEVQEAFIKLGVRTREGKTSLFNIWQLPNAEKTRDYVDVFWEVGEALMKITDEAERERLAQKTLGRSWDELKVLFGKGREEYEKALESQSSISEKAMENLAELNDKYQKLISDWETLKGEALGSLAPALTAGAEALSTLLNSVTEYLQKPEGQKLLEQLGDAVSGLFGDLAKIDPEKVVSGFAEVFSNITGGIKWLVDNVDTAKGILGVIVGSWATLKLAGGALDVLKLVQGLQGLSGGVNLSAINGVGASLGSAFASALAAVLPGILLGVLTAPTIEKLLRGETPEEKENREKIEEIVEVGKETGGAITKPTLREALSFANSNGVLPESYVERAAREAEVLTFVGADGGIYSENGDRVGYAMPKGTGLIQKFRKPGGTKTPAKEISEEVGPVDLDTHFVVSDDVDEDILRQLGFVNIPARISIVGMTGGGTGFTLDGITMMEKANGIWAVPYDGYLARLHKNERVVPAREVEHRSFSSNLYVDKMYMNNGQDVKGLSDAMASAQRREANAYGS